jgi:hypothetical protein
MLDVSQLTPPPALTVKDSLCDLKEQNRGLLLPAIANPVPLSIKFSRAESLLESSAHGPQKGPLARRGDSGERLKTVAVEGEATVMVQPEE